MDSQPSDSSLKPPRDPSPLKRIFGKLGPAMPAMAVLAAVLTVGLFAIVRDRPCTVSTVLVAGDCRGRGHRSRGARAGDSGAAGTAHAALVANDSGAAGQATREAVEKLIAEEKFEAAAAECARIREDARQRRRYNTLDLDA